MFSRLAAVVTLLAVVAGVLGQSLTINTPASVVVCQPAQLTWTGGVAPYFLSILPGNQPGAAALVDFGRQDGTSLTWTANLAAGTSIFLQVRDSAGTVGQSGTISIQSSSDTSCVGQSSSATGTATGTTTGTGSTTTPAGTTSTTSAAGGTTSATGTGTTTRATTSGTSTNTASTSTTSAAGNGAIKTGSVGVLAFAGVAAVAAFL